MTKLILLGLDGAGFELLEPWLEEGELPTLNRLIERGRADPLRSVHPPVTCPSWRCYSTGVNPGKHGVFWWEQVDRDAQTFNIPTSVDFDSPDLWDYLGQKDFKSAIINMPTTFPPQELNGWMISGGGGVDNNQYTYPPHLQTEIEDLGYEVFVNGSSESIGDNPERVDQVLDLIDTRFKVAEYLREEHDPAFLSLFIFYSNVFHHFFWDDEITKQIWKRIDSRLADFLKDEENIMIISDHGSNPVHHIFNINTWLEQQGYLQMNDGVSDGLYRLGITRDRLIKIADKLGIKNSIKQLAPRNLIDMIPNSDGSVVGKGKAEKIDWEHTMVFASGQGPVYILSDNDDDYNRLRKILKTALESLTTPSGSSVLRNVFYAEDVYHGPYVESGPDLILEQADNIHIKGTLGANSIFEQPDKWQAENHREGLIIADGPDIQQGNGFENSPQIYDIAPTILHWYDCPIPKRMDGRVLNEIFDPNSEPGNRTVKRGEYHLNTQEGIGEDQQEQMRERLQNLGYLAE